MDHQIVLNLLSIQVCFLSINYDSHFVPFDAWAVSKRKKKIHFFFKLELIIALGFRGYDIKN